MAADLRLVLWLRWKQFRLSVNYWLGIIGYETWDPTMSNRLYGLYLLIFMGGWLLLTWSLAVYETMHLSVRFLPTSAIASLRDGVFHYFPWVVLGAIVLGMIFGLRSSPMKLHEEDHVYLIGSPVHRAALILVQLGKLWLRALCWLIPLATLAAVLLAHRISSDEIGLSVLPSAAVVLPVALLAFASSWLVGTLRLARPRRGRLFLLWLVPLAIVILAAIFPAALTWPGRVLARALLGNPLAGQALGVAALAVVVLLLLARTGDRANMMDVPVAKRGSIFTTLALTFGGGLGGLGTGLSNLGLPGREPAAPGGRAMRAPRTARPLLGLPAVGGSGVLLARGALVFVRRPWTLLVAFIYTAVAAGSGALIALRGETALIWLVWLTVVIIRPPSGFLAVFRQDQSIPFLRQLLPVDNLSLLAADAALPGLLFTVVAIAVWVVIATQRGLSPLALILALLIGLLLVLSQGAVVARAATWDPALARLTFIGLGLGIVYLVAEFTNPAGAIVVACFISLILAALIKGGNRVTAVNTPLG